MSQDHLADSRETFNMENHNEEEQKQIFEENINNMYDVNKHKNPHDIAGKQGIVPA
jgi:hypothetical protein